MNKDSIKQHAPTRIGDVVEPHLSKKNWSTEKLARTLNMDIKTLQKILNQSFASDDFIENLTQALESEPTMLENFKFSTVIINQIAAANQGTHITQSATNNSEKELYERIIKQLEDRIEEQSKLIEFFKNPQ